MQYTVIGFWYEDGTPVVTGVVEGHHNVEGGSASLWQAWAEFVEADDVAEAELKAVAEIDDFVDLLPVGTRVVLGDGTKATITEVDHRDPELPYYVEFPELKLHGGYELTGRWVPTEHVTVSEEN